MEKAICVFYFLISFTTYSYCQMSDSNSDLITKYFQSDSKNFSLISNRSSDSEVRRASSYINVVQNGEQNSVYVNRLASGDSQEVDQEGNYNSFEYYNYYSQKNSSMQINQDGTLNSVQVFGENSLMKDAVINQKSDFNTIVIRNYSN